MSKNIIKKEYIWRSDLVSILMGLRHFLINKELAISGFELLMEVHLKRDTLLALLKAPLSKERSPMKPHRIRKTQTLLHKWPMRLPLWRQRTLCSILSTRFRVLVSTWVSMSRNCIRALSYSGKQLGSCMCIKAIILNGYLYCCRRATSCWSGL
ncbi:hypothetical protein K469DRAFT_288442 [Zopfia rhizophila CBS 207.26]|uniref:Uncharacterized protein n=1 Tax=Zopfia rhizophila CBS 207.26 TaxID=1314779 RepID=A0A6A6ET66_9PEZI|nr:hypothetical protein K469DRAFT_288442 [Zopfia rhizophila CBS 207.26]